MNIDSSMFMLIGFESGMVVSVDFSSLISTPTTVSTVKIPPFFFTQTFLGVNSPISIESFFDPYSFNVFSLSSPISTPTQTIIPLTAYNILT